MRRHAPVLFAPLGLGARGAAGRRAAETLDEALVAAYNTNPQILAERAKLRAIDEACRRRLPAGGRP